MTNALQSNQSTVVGGLGTQSYTVTTAGLYTLSFKSFIPYLAAGSPAVTANPVAEVQNITCTGDTSGSLNSTFFTFYTAGNAYGYYVWYNINSAGVDPAPGGGLIGIQVAAATGANANTIASDTRTAITAAVSTVTISGATSHVIITNNYPGTCTAAADGTAATSFSFSVTTAGTWGTPAISGLVVQLKQNSTVLATYSSPTPTQPIMGGSVVISASSSDVLGVVLSSLSTADNAANAVKTIVNLFQGEGQ
jgi:hypothetical protein